MKRKSLALIKLQVAAGTYEVDPAAVAEAMIEKAELKTRYDQDHHCTVRALGYEGIGQAEIGRRTGLSQASVWAILAAHDRPAVRVGRRVAA